jgi:circadian clock protein KaiA
VASSPTLQICCLISGTQSQNWQARLHEVLSVDRYIITTATNIDTLSDLLQRQGYSQDCLIVCEDGNEVRRKIAELGILLPIVIVTTSNRPEANYTDREPHILNTAVVTVNNERLGDLPDAIDRAIAMFLKLSVPQRGKLYLDIPESKTFISLTTQQQRLSEKLKERLGYLGVYYKRDPKQFFRYLPNEERKLLIARLTDVYRTIVLEYFKDSTRNLNQQIDEFVNLAFFSDISVTQVLEIHMSLIEEFSKQLKLEGRNDEVLLDYRITLIDIIAHLCELYRRSIPREA